MTQRRSTERPKPRREVREDVTRLDYERLEGLLRRLADRVAILERDLQDLRDKMRS